MNSSWQKDIDHCKYVLLDTINRHDLKDTGWKIVLDCRDGNPTLRFVFESGANFLYCPEDLFDVTVEETCENCGQATVNIKDEVLEELVEVLTTVTNTLKKGGEMRFDMWENSIEKPGYVTLYYKGEARDFVKDVAELNREIIRLQKNPIRYIIKITKDFQKELKEISKRDGLPCREEDDIGYVYGITVEVE